MAKYLDSAGLSQLWSSAKSTFYHSGNSNSTSYNWSAKSLTLGGGGQIVGSNMSSVAIYGLYLNQNQAAEDGYRAQGDNGYIQVPMISSNSMGYLYTALVRYSTAGYSYVKFILNGQAGAWKQFAYTSDLPSKSSWNYDDRYVTALGISGNNLTWTKNGTDSSITIPYATSAGSVAWGNITGKPDTYTPSDHNHDSSYLPRYEVWIEQTDDWGKTYAESHRQSLVYNTHGREWAYWIGMRSSGINYGTILRLSHDGLVQYAHKAGGGAGENWSAWKNIITSDNIGSQSVSYAGSAGSVAWSNVSGKPDTYTPSSHDHDSIYVKKSGSTMTGNLTMTEGYGIVFGTKTDGNWNTTQNSGLRILNTAGYSRDGAPGNYSVALSVSGYYGFQLACVNASNDFRLRHTSDGRDASNYGAWVNILCSNNWSTYVNLSSLGAASSSHTHSYLPLSGGTLTGQLRAPLYVMNNGTTYLDVSGSSLIVSPDGTNRYTVWHSGNDGSGSGLDADTLDGYHASKFLLDPIWNEDVNVAAEGWYRVARAKTSDMVRGITKFYLAIYGGSWSPNYAKYTVYGTWSRASAYDLHVESNSQTFRGLRTTYEGDYIYIEVYFKNSITGAKLTVPAENKINGINVSNGWEWFSGNLSAGGGTEVNATAANVTSGHTRNSYITSSGFIKINSSNDYLLLGGGGHKAVSDFSLSTHTHSNYALVGHSHSEYAASGHSHSEFMYRNGYMGDFNANNAAGVYFINPSATNKPDGDNWSNYGICLVAKSPGDTCAQMVWDYSSGRFEVRVGNNSGANWQSWRQVMYTDMTLTNSEIDAIMV